MHSLVKAACAIHNLSLATAFGGNLYARKALKPAVIAEIKDEKQRGLVMAQAWNKYNVRNIPAHLLFTATWLLERNAILKMHVDQETRSLVAFKDVLITGALVSGLAAVAAGKQLQRDYPEGFPVSDRPSTDAQVQRYQRFFRVVSTVNLITTAGSLAIGPAIVGSIIHGMRRNALRRILGL